jgi:DNA-binding CsgD family transcriptional regulator
MWAAELSDTRTDRERRLLRAALEMITANQVPRAVHRRGDIEACAPGFLKDLVLLAIHTFAGERLAAERKATALLQTVRANPRSTDLARQAGYLLPWGLLVGEHAQEAAECATWALQVGDLDPHRVSATLTILSGAVVSLEGPAAALRTFTDLPPRTIATEPPYADSIGARGVWKVAEGRLAEGMDDMLSAMDFAREGAPVNGCRHLWAFAAWGHYLRGEWDRSVLAAETAVDEAFAGGYKYSYPFEYLSGIFVPAARGEWDRADTLLQSLRRTAQPLGRVGDLLHATGHALIAQAQGDHARMHQALADWHDEPATHIDLVMAERWWRPLLAEAQIGTGRLDEADLTLRRLGPVEHIPYLRLQTTRLRALLLEHQGQAHQATKLLAGTLAQPPTADDAPLFKALAGLDYGRLLLDQGQRRQAATHLQEAHSILNALGATPSQTRCQTLLVKCGLRHHPTTGKPTGPLTERERDIARHIGLGQTNKEIAEHLCLSPKTVEFHLGNLYMKLAVTGRQALRELIQSGTLQITPP